jgi:hypothetical protein
MREGNLIGDYYYSYFYLVGDDYGEGITDDLERA